MVVYEIRDPKAPTGGRPAPLKHGRRVRPLYPVEEIRPPGIWAVPPHWGKNGNRRERARKTLSPAEIRDVRRLLAEVNANLERYGILLHFVLVAGMDGAYGIDVYDCADGEACRIIHDMEVGLDELPALLAALQREAGIMLNTAL